MRAIWIALPLLLAATPVDAAPKDIQVPREFSDPAMADQLTKMLGPLSKALMEMPIGELEAAVAGREPTPADRAKRVRDEIGPEGQKNLEATIAQAGPQMRAMQKALVESLPSLMSALGDLESRMERVTANIPDPTYPKR